MVTLLKSSGITPLSLGTCESETFVRIESRIESAATIRIESRIELGCSRLRVQCRLPQELCRTTAYYRELPYYMLRCKVIVNVMIVSCIHEHKINLNYKLQRRNDWSFLLNSERGLWYDCRFGWFENLESARHFWIESELSDSNRISMLRRSLMYRAFVAAGASYDSLNSSFLHYITTLKLNMMLYNHFIIKSW